MAIVKQIICDATGCGKVKGESNHWYMLVHTKYAYAQPIFQPDVAVIVAYLDVGVATENHHILVACGSECMHKLMDMMLIGKH